MPTSSAPLATSTHGLIETFRKVEIREPLFIVGNLRTGSTLLYRTLARDEENFACFRMVDAFLPAITMKKAAAAIGRVDAWLGGYGARVVQALDDAFLSEYSRIHDTGFLKPEEDEFTLLLDLCSASMFELFPTVERFRRFFYLDQEMHPGERAKVMKRYKWLVKRQLYHLGPHKRFLSKNPLFSCKIDSLNRTFPDAKFICLVRNPVNTVLSTASLFHFVWHQTGALSPDEQDMDTIMEFCGAFYRYPQKKLTEFGPDRTLFVQFKDLVTDPGRTVRTIFDALHIPIPMSLVRVLADATPRQRKFKSKHKYTAESWGITEAEIYEAFEDVYESYGFDPPEAAAG